ncbi:MAG: hypothetical protein WCF57_09520 [Pyrinomonadaceae bacterium]
MPEEKDSCTNISVRVALKRNETQKIEFSLNKECTDGQSKYTIHFALLEKKDDAYEPKISVDVDVSKEAPDKKDEAEETVNTGLSENQVLYIRGPVARAADKAIAKPDMNPLAALLTDMETNFLREDESASQGLELLDTAAATRRDNLQKLRDRMVSVLDIG